jgi:hypothetical protein
MSWENSYWWGEGEGKDMRRKFMIGLSIRKDWSVSRTLLTDTNEMALHLAWMP